MDEWIPLPFPPSHQSVEDIYPLLVTILKLACLGLLITRLDKNIFFYTLFFTSLVVMNVVLVDGM